MNTLPSALSRLATSEKPAILFEGTQITYKELNHLSTKTAGGLQQLTQPGDLVAFQTKNSIDLIVFFLAALKNGNPIVPINRHFKEKEVESVLTDCSPTYLYTTTLPKGPWTPPRINASDPAIVFYTSGTTGKPKGAILNHTNILSNITTLHRTWQWTEKDTLLLALPLHHIHGLGIALLGALLAGNTIHLKRRFNATDVLSTIEQHPITLFMGTPTMYALMLEAPSSYTNSMRLFVSGSAPLSQTLYRRFKERTGHSIVERAGMSETMINFSNLPAQTKPGTVGPPLPGIDLCILDDNKQPTPIGELAVRGPNVFDRYLNKNKEPYFHNNYFLTGDIGTIDEDGYVTILGRKDDAIITGGVNIYPKEIEDVLLSLEGVQECAVTKLDHPLYGEVPQAFIVAKQLTKEAIISHCQQHLANFKVPRTIHFVEHLPFNAMGKLDRKALPLLQKS